MDIIEIIERYGITFPENQLKSFKKDFYRNYKSVAEFHKNIKIRKQLEKDLRDYKILVKEMKEDYNKLGIDNQKIKNELIIYYGKEKTKQAGVELQYIDFVTYKILSRIDNIHDFEGILKEYLKTHKEYKRKNQ